MSYERERFQFEAAVVAAGLPHQIVPKLLRAATTLQRLSELECSSEAADRDRVECPALVGATCLCDQYRDTHQTVPRIVVQGAQVERRIRRVLAKDAPAFIPEFQGDPRGYVLRLKHDDREYGVPSRPSRLRF